VASGIHLRPLAWTLGVFCLVGVIFWWLINQDPPPNSIKAIIPFGTAVIYGDAATVDRFLKAGHRLGYAQDKEKPCDSYLVTAVKFGHADVAQLLMAHGADPNQKWAGGRNVLSCVLAEGFNKDPALIRLSIDRGASVNQAEDDGTTPLMLASKSGNAQIVTLLIEKSADLTARDRTGKTALDLASAAHQRETYDLLFDKRCSAHVAVS
jgi:ankyrin repeat protein